MPVERVSDYLPVHTMENAEAAVEKTGKLEPSTIVYPEYCRTQKERECWLLFQKMAKKGKLVQRIIYLKQIFQL